MHLKTDNSYNELSIGDVAQSYSCRFVLRSGIILEMDPLGQRRAADSESRRRALRSLTDSGG